MSKSYDITTRAVVIGRASAGEGSARIYFYTEYAGLVGAFAKSAREERSKLRPHLQSGCYGLYTLVRGERDWRVTGASDVRSVHFELAAHPKAQQGAARVFSLLRQLVHGEEENAPLFEALFAFVSSLPALSPEEAHTAERLAVLRILHALGYVPAGLSIPHVEHARYSGDVLAEVAPFERELVGTINAALLASNLV